MAMEIFLFALFAVVCVLFSVSVLAVGGEDETPRRVP